jgi:anti-sigma B factor antagonist
MTPTDSGSHAGHHPVAAATLPRSELLTVTAESVRPGVVVITLRGEVDLFTCPVLRNSLRARTHEAGRLLIVDLTGVTFFGAAGLAALAAARGAALTEGFGLCLIARTRPVLMPLNVTGFDSMVDIYPDLAEALLREDGGPNG